MQRARLFKAVNALLLVSVAVQAASAIIIFFRIRVVNMVMVGEVHEYNGIIMIVLVAAHIALNWGWIRSNFFKK